MKQLLAYVSVDMGCYYIERKLNHIDIRSAFDNMMHMYSVE